MATEIKLDKFVYNDESHNIVLHKKIVTICTLLGIKHEAFIKFSEQLNIIAKLF